MDDYMDYTCGVTGMNKITDEQANTVIEKVRQAAEQAIRAGYKYFWLALIGTASVHYATGVKEAINGHDGVTLELMIPYPHWKDKMLSPEQYKQVTQNTDGSMYVDNFPISDIMMLTNNRVLDLATRMIIVSDGKDKEAQSIIKIARDIETPVTVISP